jgi:bifunctional DNA-binding transcriptional regulator/antitoxin component of YhaV-PrlF toxin-antitoxin module
MVNKTLIEVTHVSRRGVSLRVTLPKKVGEMLHIVPGDIVGFYSDDSRIVIEKMT